MITLKEMKEYLRVDFDDDDTLINDLILSSTEICKSIIRSDDIESKNFKIAVMYATAYLYEHREEADHHALTITLRNLLFTDRYEVF